jgi:hypothetical protein
MTRFLCCDSPKNPHLYSNVNQIKPAYFNRTFFLFVQFLKKKKALLLAVAAPNRSYIRRHITKYHYSIYIY